MSLARSFGKKDEHKLMDWIVLGDDSKFFGEVKDYSKTNGF